MDPFSNIGGIVPDTCTPADIDRLLGLADQFLDDWAEDAVQAGQRDQEYEKCSEEWRAIRPLLLSASEMLRGLKSIVTFCDGSPDPVARCCFSIARASLASLVADVTTRTSNGSRAQTASPTLRFSRIEAR